jgi:hypothetical protein
MEFPVRAGEEIMQVRMDPAEGIYAIERTVDDAGRWTFDIADVEVDSVRLQVSVTLPEDRETVVSRSTGDEGEPIFLLNGREIESSFRWLP